MWDNVVSWMKKAVDLVTFDEPLEAEPTPDDVSLGKVCVCVHSALHIHVYVHVYA